MEISAKKSKIIDFIDKYYYLLLVIAFALLCFACFFGIGKSVVCDFDESRHGVNAYEMIKNGNYIANYYNGELDYWNLKPPISFYFVVLGYKIFGYNAWGLRFFSALSYIILALCVALFLKKRVSKSASIISVLLFAGCFHYFLTHFVRSGDPDALFILFIGLGIIFLLQSSENKNYLCITGLMFALAFLTKSWHAFILAPIVLFYLIFTKGFKGIKWWQYITAFLCALVPIAIWAIIRYSFDGWTFLKNMFEYDLLKRSSNAIENHNEPFFFYFYALFLNVPLLLCFIATISDIIIKIRRKENLGSFNIVAIVSYVTIMLFYTIAKTKLIWYIFPLCTPMIISGAPIIDDYLKKVKYKKTFLSLFMLFSAVCYAATIYCVTLSFGNINQKNGLEMQTFICSAEIPENSTIYYQDETTDVICQSALLYVEWRSNNYAKDGGWEAFNSEIGSYILVSKKYYESVPIGETINVLYGDMNYLLCYNAG